MRYLIVTIAIFTLFVSCEYFEQGPTEIPVARVNESYLYKKDIEGLVSETTSKEDSALIVSNYINRWATQQLLINQAKINLNQDQLNLYDKLVLDYKNDLYTEAYKNAIVLQQMDSTVSVSELRDFYDLNKENFKLNDDLIKVRYIQVDQNYTDLSNTIEKFKRFSKKDKEELNNLNIKFKTYNFNDSTWVKKDALYTALPVIKDKSEEVLKKSNFTQLQDSLGVYLVKIEDLLKPNDIAPLSYITPTIEQIILNKRKLELIKKLEKDITKDAIKNNKFEIYTNQ
jgi:hypothetical protein